MRQSQRQPDGRSSLCKKPVIRGVTKSAVDSRPVRGASSRLRVRRLRAARHFTSSAIDTVIRDR
jgi:hypothetical protein